MSLTPVLGSDTARDRFFLAVAYRPYTSMCMYIEIRNMGCRPRKDKCRCCMAREDVLTFRLFWDGISKRAISSEMFARAEEWQEIQSFQDPKMGALLYLKYYLPKPFWCHFLLLFSYWFPRLEPLKRIPSKRHKPFFWWQEGGWSLPSKMRSRMPSRFQM